MSVDISELEVVPRAEREQRLQQPRDQAADGGQQSPSPQQEHELERAVALMNARALRLRAD